jgi:hypothetical protein
MKGALKGKRCVHHDFRSDSVNQNLHSRRGYPGHEHELRPEFVEGLNKLKDFIVSESPTIKTPIQAGSNTLIMQPDILVALIEQYVE